MIGTQLEVNILRWAVVALLCVSATGWGCAVVRGGKNATAKADVKVAQHREGEAIQGARDAAKSTDVVLGVARDCAEESKRVSKENADALAAALAAKADAQAEAEAYQRKLARMAADKSNAGDQCQAFLQARVCKDLMDY